MCTELLKLKETLDREITSVEWFAASRELQKVFREFLSAEYERSRKNESLGDNEYKHIRNRIVMQNGTIDLIGRDDEKVVGVKPTKEE